MQAIQLNFWEDAQVISTYTRAQAIEDGVLVDLMRGETEEICRQHYRYPIACTASVWAMVQKAVNHPRWCNDIRGVLHDILWMSRCYRPKGLVTEWLFKVTITGTGRKRNHILKMHIGPGDDGQPV